MVEAGSAWSLLGCAMLAALLTLAATPIVRTLAVRAGIVAEPSTRRIHTAPTPTLGGFAVAVSVLGALLAVDEMSGGGVVELLARYGWHWGYFLLGAGIILGAGAVDDIYDLSPSAKLGAQTVAAIVALAGGYGVSAVTNPLTGGYIYLGIFGGALTVLWIVAVTNAFNLIDGLDGLAAGVGLIACCSIMMIAQVEMRPDAALIASALAGALLGFLRYNFHPASIFLGDSGSQLLGYTLSLLSIQGLQKGATTVVIIVPILALGFPLLDTLVAILRRFVVAGVAAIFRADRQHIHHRLIAMGMTQRRAVLVLYCVCALFGAAAFFSVVARGPVKGVLLGVVIGTTFAGVRLLRKHAERRQQGPEPRRLYDDAKPYLQP